MNWLLGIATILLVAVTFMVYYATTKVSKATQEVSVATKMVSQNQIRPYVFAYLREKKKGVGIYVENAGFGPAFNGQVKVKTSAGEVNYDFTRLYPHTRNEHPTGQQGKINISDPDKGIIVSIHYADMEGNSYTRDTFLTFDGWT